MAPLLQVESSTKRFGGLLANRGVSLTMEAGEIVGLIGPNGAGKTTLFNCITGYMHPDEGRIVFDTTRADGTPRKVMDVSALKALGWTAPTSLEAGLKLYYQWFLASSGSLRQ